MFFTPNSLWRARNPSLRKLVEYDETVRAVRRWVEGFIVELNLCPFAGRELVSNRIRFVVTDSTTEEQLLAALATEFTLLNDDAAVETTLLIHPDVLQDFFDYNQFLDSADQLLVQMGLEGVCQVASFHPDYQFSGTAADDAENYTNRSPYPLLHILREASLERSIAAYPDVDKIPDRNIELMRSLGREKLQALMQGFSDDSRD
jgi:hypothetical protein